MSNFTERIAEISKLAQSKNLHAGKFKEFLTEALSFLGVTLSGEVRFWLKRVNDDALEAIQSFSEGGDKVSGDNAISLKDFKDFNDLLHNSYLTELELGVDSNQNDPSMAYLIENHLKSWLSVQVWSDRRFFGVISVEWLSKRAITDQERAVLFGIASMVGQCYDGFLRLRGELISENDSGVEVIDFFQSPETERLQKKLSDHAFFTSHNIRHPLSTMLALVDLIKINWEDRENYEELIQQLKIEAMNLDEIIRVMTAKIELD